MSQKTRFPIHPVISNQGNCMYIVIGFAKYFFLVFLNFRYFSPCVFAVNLFDSSNIYNVPTTNKMCSKTQILIKVEDYLSKVHHIYISCNIVYQKAFHKQCIFFNIHK